jgi:1-acyl-sn-glycerol-3-phosphate acyltransferase
MVACMRLRKFIVNNLVKFITRVICRVDDAELHKIPSKGPLILAANHINFIEAPLMYTHMLPRPISAYAKAEHWENRAGAFLFDTWDAIPIRRGEADMTALKRGIAAIKQGNIFAIAPEGTRSGDGKLMRGNPGVVMLALKSDAPIMPAVYFGHEVFWDFIRKLRRTPFNIRVGKAFRLVPGTARVTSEVRQQMVDEIMYQMAALLPPENRGVYSDQSQATQDYIQFID